MVPRNVWSGYQQLQKLNLRAPGCNHDSTSAPQSNCFTNQSRGFVRGGLRQPSLVVEFAQVQSGPSGARRRKNLHVNAVDVQEVDARGHIALNDLCSCPFQAFRKDSAVELSGEAIVVDAHFMAGLG